MALDLEQAVATGHIAAASASLVIGAVVLGRPKGTHRHRVLGVVYVVALVVVNAAALSLHREDTFGVFHVLAVASLVSIAAGLSIIVTGNGSEVAVATHAYFMSWSYAGVVAAGCGQLAAALGDDGTWLVPATILTVLVLSGVVIFRRVPHIVDNLLSG